MFSGIQPSSAIIVRRYAVKQEKDFASERSPLFSVDAMGRATLIHVIKLQIEPFFVIIDILKMEKMDDVTSLHPT